MTSISKSGKTTTKKRKVTNTARKGANFELEMEKHLAGDQEDRTYGGWLHHAVISILAARS